MKRLFVLRHAKSSWEDASLADFDRPLNERGREAAPFMGRLMAREKLAPDAIYASPARRARETAELVRAAAGFDVAIAFDERIYEASAHTLLKILTQLDEGVAAPMLVGHNPGMEGLVRMISGSAEEMPTAALAVIKVRAENWHSLDEGGGKLVKMYRSKAEIRRVESES